LISTQTARYISPLDGVMLSTRSGPFSVKVDARDTDDAYVMMVGSVPAGGGPPPLHRHPWAESMVVLGGAVEVLTLGERGLEVIRPSVEGVVHIPSGAPHTFSNVGGSVATLLYVASPSLLAFLREIEETALADGVLDMAKALPVAAAHQVHFIQP
jgi:quercetin dioxygenase-like cupin family protein